MDRVFDAAKLQLDCEKCDVLCCVAFKLPYPDYQKPGGIACKNLDETKCRCTVHSDLERREYSSCLQFDCRGAGVAVSQLFRGMGRTWITDPEIATVEFHTFVIVYYTVLKHLYPDVDFEFNVLDEFPAKLQIDLSPFTEAALDLLAPGQSDMA
jgi:hypothetical protein